MSQSLLPRFMEPAVQIIPWCSSLICQNNITRKSESSPSITVFWFSADCKTCLTIRVSAFHTSSSESIRLWQLRAQNVYETPCVCLVWTKNISAESSYCMGSYVDVRSTEWSSSGLSSVFGYVVFLLRYNHQRQQWIHYNVSLHVLHTMPHVSWPLQFLQKKTSINNVPRATFWFRD